MGEKGVDCKRPTSATGALQQCTSTMTGEPGGKKGGAGVGISWALSCTAGKVKCFENHLFFGESVSTVVARAGKGGKISWLVCTDSGCEALHCSGSANQLTAVFPCTLRILHSTFQGNNLCEFKFMFFRNIRFSTISL